MDDAARALGEHVSNYKSFEQMNAREKADQLFREGWLDISYPHTVSAPTAEHPAFVAGRKAAQEALDAALLKFSLEWSELAAAVPTVRQDASMLPECEHRVPISMTCIDCEITESVKAKRLSDFEQVRMGERTRIMDIVNKTFDDAESELQHPMWHSELGALQKLRDTIKAELGRTTSSEL